MRIRCTGVFHSHRRGGQHVIPPLQVRGWSKHPTGRPIRYRWGLSLRIAGLHEVAGRWEEASACLRAIVGNDDDEVLASAREAAGEEEEKAQLVPAVLWSRVALAENHICAAAAAASYERKVAKAVAKLQTVKGSNEVTEEGVVLF